MVHPARFELTTFCSGGRRSIQLSYGCIFKHIYTTARLKKTKPHFNLNIEFVNFEPRIRIQLVINKLTLLFSDLISKIHIKKEKKS